MSKNSINEVIVGAYNYSTNKGKVEVLHYIAEFSNFAFVAGLAPLLVIAMMWRKKRKLGRKRMEKVEEAKNPSEKNAGEDLLERWMRFVSREEKVE